MYKEPSFTELLESPKEVDTIKFVVVSAGFDFVSRYTVPAERLALSPN